MTPDGSMAETHLHLIGVTITHASKARAHAEAAEAICRQCPALDACRQYAALSKWQSVTVAGWSAPNHTDAFPPWTPWFCIGCGGDLPEHPDHRSGMWCLGCNQMRKTERAQRWSGYVDESRGRGGLDEEPVGVPS